jgi:hypothetical protein
VVLGILEDRKKQSELSDEDYHKLKNVMWLLRKKHNELSDTEKETLALLFKFSPLLKKAYQLQNKLTAIFNQSISQKQAKRKIKQWIKAVEKSELRFIFYGGLICQTRKMIWFWNWQLPQALKQSSRII